MPERQPAWKQTLKEPNAIGWISLILVVIAIGLGVIYFGNDNGPPSGEMTTGQAVR